MQPGSCSHGGCRPARRGSGRPPQPSARRHMDPGARRPWCAARPPSAPRGSPHHGRLEWRTGAAPARASPERRTAARQRRLDHIARFAVGILPARLRLTKVPTASHYEASMQCQVNVNTGPAIGLPAEVSSALDRWRVAEVHQHTAMMPPERVAACGSSGEARCCKKTKPHPAKSWSGSVSQDAFPFRGVSGGAPTKSRTALHLPSPRSKFYASSVSALPPSNASLFGRSRAPWTWLRFEPLPIRWGVLGYSSTFF